ncbi:MAG: SHOCT domain-containing protein [Desulfobulbaceae bacterium]|jgi:putative membrane protein|nr:SHOCT domain-containing protein [Desulfobulbaceae bacterium]MDY0351218.1 SHOCT domain-containing protein [Desulfobulbaceae bacterium]
MWHCNWGYPFGHGWFAGHGLLGAFVGLLLLLLLISLAVTVIRSVISKAGGDRDRQDSLEILRVKLARGEISAEEYQRIRGILRG